tara:strand:+ start:47448 stop:47705 length:258 start_codon:yes stop_codon:yes gene_type:complete
MAGFALAKLTFLEKLLALLSYAFKESTSVTKYMPFLEFHFVMKITSFCIKPKFSVSASACIAVYLRYFNPLSQVSLTFSTIKRSK